MFEDNCETPAKELVAAVARVTNPAGKSSAKPDKVKPKSELDLSGATVGAAVRHKLFGAGEIIAISDKIVAVKFGTKEKNFEFPNAFENGFLRLV